MTSEKIPPLPTKCATHGETVTFKLLRSGKERSLRYRCNKCLSEAVARRRRKVKAMLVDDFGGRCTICGYSKCVKALQFHHLDGDDKDFGIAAKGHTRSYEKIKEEASKCLLVCANCHAEIHAGLITIPR